MVQAKAAGTTYQKSVTCSCCGDIATVSHRYDYNSSTDITTRSYEVRSTVNSLEQWLHVQGRVGNRYGADLTVGCNREMGNTYYWGDAYDLYAEKGRADFGICKGENWAWVYGMWQS